MLSHFTLLAQFGMCDVFLFATDPGASNQTNFTFVRMSFKISFRTGSHVSDGLMQTSYRDGSKGQDESDCSKNFFSLKEFAWTREGGGPELRWQRMQGSGWQSTDKHPFATFYLNSLQISPFLTKDVFWKMKLHIEDSAIFDGYSACLQISA